MQAWNLREQWRGQGAGDDREPGVGNLVDQGLDQARGKHRVADPARRDEQDREGFGHHSKGL